MARCSSSIMAEAGEVKSVARCSSSIMAETGEVKTVARFNSSNRPRRAKRLTLTPLIEPPPQFHQA